VEAMRGDRLCFLSHLSRTSACVELCVINAGFAPHAYIRTKRIQHPCVLEPRLSTCQDNVWLASTAASSEQALSTATHCCDGENTQLAGHARLRPFQGCEVFMRRRCQ